MRRPMDGLVLADKPAGKTSHDLVVAGPPRPGRAARRARRARSTRSRPASSWSSWAAGGASSASSWRCRRPTRRSRASAPSRRRATPRARSRPRAWSRRGRCGSPPAGCASARPPTAPSTSTAVAPTSARGRGGRRRPRARGRRAPLRGALAGGRPRGPADRVLVGDLRPQPRGRPRRRLHRGAPAHAPSGRSGCEDADPHRVLPLAEALAFLPAVALDPRHGAAGRLRPGGPGARAPAGAEHVLLVDDDGPIAIAEPREGAGLKPVVGFRSA